MKSRFILLLVQGASIGCLASDWATLAPASKSDIMVIVADDIGFSNPGCYGGEIQDRLAKNDLHLPTFTIPPDGPKVLTIPANAPRFI